MRQLSWLPLAPLALASPTSRLPATAGQVTRARSVRRLAASALAHDNCAGVTVPDDGIVPDDGTTCCHLDSQVANIIHQVNTTTLAAVYAAANNLLNAGVDISPSAIMDSTVSNNFMDISATTNQIVSAADLDSFCTTSIGSSTLQEAIDYLGAFARYYRRFVKGKRWSAAELEEIKSLMRTTANMFLSLDLQIAARAKRDRTRFQAHVRQIITTMETIFSDIVINTASVHPDHFEVSPNDTQTPLSAHWEIQ